MRALSLVDSILKQRHASVYAVLWLFFAAFDQGKVIAAVFAAIGELVHHGSGQVYAEAANMTLFEGRIDVGFGSVVEGIEGAAFVCDVDSNGVGIRLEVELDLLIVVIVAVVNDVEDKLFNDEVDTEKEVGRPCLVGGEMPRRRRLCRRALHGRT